MTPIEKTELVTDPAVLGNDYIYKIAGWEFDAQRLYDEFIQITTANHVPWQSFGQFCLTVRSEAIKEGKSDKELFFDFNGSLAAIKNHIKTVYESEFDTIHPLLAGTYTEEVLKQVMAKYPNVGRVRWLMLKPKTCYSMHMDPDWYRLHIPVKTNPKSFFIVDEQYFTMPEVGKMYAIHPQPNHTAVNANLHEERLHIVFDSSEEIVLYS